MIGAGGEAYALYLAWRYGSEDPYCLFNGLDRAFRPLQGGAPRPPPWPGRYKAFLYACAVWAQRDEVDRATVIAGGSIQRRR